MSVAKPDLVTGSLKPESVAGTPTPARSGIGRLANHKVRNRVVSGSSAIGAEQATLGICLS